MTESELRNLTSPEQVKVLENLTQQAAGWLLDLTARTMRDHPSIPRAADGTYNAADLVRWQAGRMERATLSDTDYERLLVIAEEIDVIHGLAEAVKVIRDLRQVYGDAVLVELAEMLLRNWGELLDLDPGGYSLPTPAELRKKAEAARRFDADIAAHRELRVATICDRCKKLRRGRKWIRAEPPAGFAVMRGECPPCAASAR